MLVSSPPVQNVKFNEYSKAQWALLCVLRGKMFLRGDLCKPHYAMHGTCVEIFNQMLRKMFLHLLFGNNNASFPLSKRLGTFDSMLASEPLWFAPPVSRRITSRSKHSCGQVRMWNVQHPQLFYYVHFYETFPLLQNEPLCVTVLVFQLL